MASYRLRERMHEDLVRDLLLARGIGEGEAADFLKPSFEGHSHDPFLMPDMEAAVLRVFAARKAGEKVAVWSDYDCDGIPGGVLLSEFLRGMGLYVRHYIPHRHEEGYGLNVDGIAALAEEGITLIVTVDLGTTDRAPISFARSKGIDVIVTDHHLPAGDLPDALILNPKRADSRYPFPHLCGSGVAWKLVQAILSKNRAGGSPTAPPFDYAQGKEKWLLDLVGLATLSDRVPLIGENRMLAHYGLTVMRRARRPGLAALLSLLRIKPRDLTEDDVGFMVAPRINAASRMARPETAAALLAATTPEEGATLARELNRINDERKGTVAATVKDARKRLAERPITNGIIVMGSPNWRPGILGLVASSLAESENSTVFLWGREGGELLRGSCRSSGSVNVVSLMGEARDLFDHFGGHALSGGFSLRQEHAHELEGRLSSAYEHLHSQGIEDAEVIIDRHLDMEEIPRAFREVLRLSPFGEGNRKPLFLFQNASVSRMRTFGKQNDHLELSLEGSGSRIAGIAFFSTPDSFAKRPAVGMRADIVGHLEADWGGRPRIRVVDVL